MPAAAQDPPPSPNPTLASPTQPSAASDPTLKTAWDKAATSGKPVEVPSRFTETMKVWAQPDGKNLRAELHTQPVQLKNKASGAWEPVDTRIVTHGGTLQAARVKTPLTFGGRGTKHLVSAAEEEGKIALEVTRALPEPKISGSTVTYPDAVAPGADLVVLALADGFVSQVVFRRKPDGPVTVRLPLTLPKGTSFGKGPEGLPQLKDAEGRAKAAPVVLTAMDAKVEASPEQGKSSPVTARVETSGATSQLVFTPDAAFLADPALTYPVTIAAASQWFGGGTPDDAWVSKNSPSSNNAAAGWLRAGTTQTSADIARTYLKFNTTAPELVGATVVDADLYVWNYKSGGPNGQLCGNEIGSGIAASLITSAWTPTGLRWSNQPSNAGIMTGSGNKAGYNIDASGTWCASEAALVHRVTGMARAWIEQGVANHGLVLRAVTESPAINWRQYYASEYSGDPYPGYRHPPTLMIEYTPAPEYPPGDDVGWFKAGEGFPDSATADQIRAATYRSSQPIEAGEVSDAEAEAMQGQAPEFVENPAVTFGRPADVSQEEWNSLNPNNPQPDPDQPSVIRTVPDLGATNAQPDVHVEARFSEPVTGAHITLKDRTGQTVPGTSGANASGDGATFVPDAPLAPGMQYTAEVSGAQDADGHPMVAPYDWPFTITLSTSTPTPTPTDPPGEQRTISLPVQADTWVDDHGSVGPQGPTLWSGAYDYEQFKAIERSFLSFDTSSIAGKTIVGAELELWNSSAYGCGTSQSGIKAQLLTQPWNADLLTWDDQPATSGEGESIARDPGGCADDSPATDVAWTWQVKDIVQAWASGQDDYGFMLRGVDESSDAPQYDRGFHSAETEAEVPHPPVLKVTFIDGGSGPSPSPTAGPDTVPPTVVAVEPADDADDVAPAAQIKVTFSEPVAAASLALVDIFTEEGLPGDTTMSPDRRVLTFTPRWPLDSWYWSTVSGVTDDAGNAMAEPYEWWFGVGPLLTMAQKKARASATTAGGPSVSRAWTRTRKAGDGVAKLVTTTPEFMIKVAAPGKRHAVVEVQVEHGPKVPAQGKGLIWSGIAKSGPGSVGIVRMPTGKIIDGWDVRWRARALSGGVIGAWSGWQAVTVDTSRAAPLASVQAVAAEPTFTYDRIENDAQCRALTGPKAYTVKNSYNWCMWGEIGSQVSFYVNRRRVGSVRYDARVTLTAHSFTGESKSTAARLANQYGSRQFKVYFHLDKLERSGKTNIPALLPTVKAGAETFPFSLGLAFNPTNKCSVSPIGLNKFIYKTPEAWEQEGGNFTFTSDPADFAAPDHRARCKLQPQVHMLEQVEDPYAYLMQENPVFRCDSSPAIKTAKGGCVVFKDGRPVFELSKAAQVKGPGNQLMTNPVKESAQHIWDAWNNPVSTVPFDPNKKVPGFSWSTPLQRNTDTSKKGLGGQNREVAIKQCDISFSDPRPRPPGLRYTRKLKDPQGNTIRRSCDEFPFAATHQGASLAGTNYSARAILASDNSTAGSWMGWWFERNRVLEKQKFTVRISDSQEPGSLGYYPPPGTDTLADEQIVPDAEAS
ncbi:DNRLRE domain-containing protein [Sphaerisporangium sp. NPDC005288]|uniref:DNRLRE domain-containing protein n=1 Tax=Sphaerisporangium sp. NPDC005288 TaxID=3155114 RepID=UPI0033A8B791